MKAINGLTQRVDLLFEETTKTRKERIQKHVSGMNRTQLSQQEWKNLLINTYKRRGSRGKIKCMILDSEFNSGDVTAAHLWNRSGNGSDLADFGLPISAIDSYRMGILVAKGIEQAWTFDYVAFIPDPSKSTFVLWVLNPLILDDFVEPSKTKFSDIHGAILKIPAGIEPPYRRIMNFKSRVAVNQAKKLYSDYWGQKEKQGTIDFEDFWQLSDKTSQNGQKLHIYPESLFGSDTSSTFSSASNDVDPATLDTKKEIERIRCNQCGEDGAMYVEDKDKDRFNCVNCGRGYRKKRKTEVRLND